MQYTVSSCLVFSVSYFILQDSNLLSFFSNLNLPSPTVVALILRMGASAELGAQIPTKFHYLPHQRRLVLFQTAVRLPVLLVSFLRFTKENNLITAICTEICSVRGLVLLSIMFHFSGKSIQFYFEYLRNFSTGWMVSFFSYWLSGKLAHLDCPKF